MKVGEGMKKPYQQNKMYSMVFFFYITVFDVYQQSTTASVEEK